MARAINRGVNGTKIREEGKRLAGVSAQASNCTLEVEGSKNSAQEKGSHSRSGSGSGRGGMAINMG